MKSAILLLSIASIGSVGVDPAPVACPAPAGAQAAASSDHTRFDPLVIDLGKDRKAAPPACEHAINTKGTGVAGRAAADHAINTKGTGTSGRATAKLAIKTKGTSAHREAAAPAPGGDCDDGDAIASADTAAGAIAPSKSEMAIKCKGTGAQ